MENYLVESGEWRVESGKWKMENGKWKVLVEEIGFSNEKCFVPGCINIVRFSFIARQAPLR